jgi:CheY-like chemotaxis protein
MMSQGQALVVDDAAANRDFLARLLGGANFEVIAFGTGKAALSAVSSQTELPLAIVDMKLPDMNGMELVCQLRQRFPRTYLVIATMYDERSMMEEAFSKGCNVFLVKPHGFMELFKRLMTGKLEEMLDNPPLIIDQFGPRLFKTATQTAAKIAAVKPV